MRRLNGTLRIAVALLVAALSTGCATERCSTIPPWPTAGPGVAYELEMALAPYDENGESVVYPELGRWLGELYNFKQQLYLEPADPE